MKQFVRFGDASFENSSRSKLRDYRASCGIVNNWFAQDFLFWQLIKRYYADT